HADTRAPAPAVEEHHDLRGNDGRLARAGTRLHVERAVPREHVEHTRPGRVAFFARGDLRRVRAALVLGHETVAPSPSAGPCGGKSFFQVAYSIAFTRYSGSRSRAVEASSSRRSCASRSNCPKYCAASAFDAFFLSRGS